MEWFYSFISGFVDVFCGEENGGQLRLSLSRLLGVTTFCVFSNQLGQSIICQFS